MSLSPRQFDPHMDWDRDPSLDEPEGRYYHGSKHVIEPGTVLESSNARGVEGNYDYDFMSEREDLSSQKDWVYSTSGEGEARGWAAGGSEEHGNRRYVYEVDPDFSVKPDEDTGGAAETDRHFISETATVLNRIDIPQPVEYGRPVQGTLAPYDWASVGHPTRPRPDRAERGWNKYHDFRDPNAALHSNLDVNPEVEGWHSTLREHDVKQEIEESGSTYGGREPLPRPLSRMQMRGQQKLF